MNQFLIPANTKKGQLIAGFMKPVDLGILITGMAITFICLLVISNLGDDLSEWIKILAVLPFGIAALLVFPVPYYHNVRVGIMEIYYFYTNNRSYKWRGWCAVYESNRTTK